MSVQMIELSLLTEEWLEHSYGLRSLSAKARFLSTLTLNRPHYSKQKFCLISRRSNLAAISFWSSLSSYFAGTAFAGRIGQHADSRSEPRKHVMTTLGAVHVIVVDSPRWLSIHHATLVQTWRRCVDLLLERRRPCDGRLIRTTDIPFFVRVFTHSILHLTGVRKHSTLASSVVKTNDTLRRFDLPNIVSIYLSEVL